MCSVPDLARLMSQSSRYRGGLYLSDRRSAWEFSGSVRDVSELY